VCWCIECAVELDIVFVVDVSGSLEVTGYDIHLSLMRTVVQGLNFQFGRTRVAYVTFAQFSTIQFNLDAYSSSEDVMNAIAIDSVETGTNISGALRTVRTQVGHPCYGVLCMTIMHIMMFILGDA